MRLILIAATAVVTAAGCSSPPGTGAIRTAYTETESPISDLDNPTTPDELRGASILDTDRYRPQYQIVGCKGERLPTEAVAPDLASAIAEAKAYSDAAKGVGLLVMHDGVIVHESYTQGAGESTRTVSASMMKSVMALLYGIAIERGLIASVDDPVSQYLPQWANDPRGDITLRQLLTMSSGLAPSNFSELLLAPDVGAVALRTPLAEPPGDVFTYNNAVSKILAIALERQVRAAGYDGIPEFLQRELWCPLGNGDAQMWIDQAGNARGYAGLQANLCDWARIGELIRRRGAMYGQQIVPADWIAAMETPSPANPQYGLHVWLGAEWTERRRYSSANPLTILHSEAFAAPDVVYLDGFGGQRVYVVRSKGLTIVRTSLTNLEYDDAIVPNLLIRATD